MKEEKEVEDDWNEEDAEPGDENDPEYELEMFRTYRAMGWKPEEFPDRDYGARYAEWLKATPPEEE